MYSLKNWSDPTLFLEACEPYLLAHESEHNLFLGILENLRKGWRASDSALYCSLEENGRTVGYGLRTHPERPFIVSRMPVPAAEKFAELLKELAPLSPLNQCLGISEVSEAFARRWTEDNPQLLHLKMHQGIYELTELKLPQFSGEMVSIAEVSPACSLRFIQGFIEHAFPNDPAEWRGIPELEKRHRELKTLYFWRNPKGEIVSTAAKSRETRNGSTISLVYTPPEFRGRGYASQVVAKLGEQELKRGKKFCNLFTDLSNPSSNSIYQKLGYKKISESKHWAFRKVSVTLSARPE